MWEEAVVLLTDEKSPKALDRLGQTQRHLNTYEV